MLQILIDWYRRTFSNTEAVMLFLALLFLLLLITFLGNMLAPVIASIIIAYLLQGIVGLLERMKIPHVISVLIVYLLFLGLVFALLGLLPMLWRQVVGLVNELPNMITQLQALLVTLPENYPDYVTVEQIDSWVAQSKLLLARFGQQVLSVSLAFIPGVITLVVYLVLTPLLIYFFLMDKEKITTWLTNFMPTQRGLINSVWSEVNQQIWNYVSGKVLEIFIMGIIAYITFAIFGLNYAMLLAVFVGLSVIIPYIGAIVMTFPIMIIAFLQWGFGPEFVYIFIAYLVMQTFDANVLVPIVFSEVMKLHPVAIILAILLFGGIWGFWGVFFAIPLATVVKSVISAWPKEQN